jgi:hypothetical protein
VDAIVVGFRARKLPFTNPRPLPNQTAVGAAIGAPVRERRQGLGPFCCGRFFVFGVEPVFLAPTAWHPVAPIGVYENMVALTGIERV